MIVLFTDYGHQDAYVGQLHAVLAQQAPNEIVIDLLHNVPKYNLRAAAYLLASYANEFPPGTIFVCIVDPGVGSSRLPLVIEADGKWFVGPGDDQPTSGLFTQVIFKAKQSKCFSIEWRPDRLSNTFHGRDIFAPVAAKLALGHLPELAAISVGEKNSEDWPGDLLQIIYIDHFGNSITGIEANRLADDSILVAGTHSLAFARTFSEVRKNDCFWYKNSIGLVEIAANQACAADIIGIKVGDCIHVQEIN
ncbi:S-adenosyl-l-methionine hydroxide adenosyltransferase family protein [Pseudomonadota bacterium]